MKQLITIHTFVCSLFSLLFLLNTAYGQCGDNPSQTISYDTIVSGVGNDNFSFLFRQFDPSIGTLAQVDIETSITVKYNYKLENTQAVATTYKVYVSRMDEIVVSAMAAPLSNVTPPKIIGNHALAAYDGVLGSGTDYMEKGPVYAFQNFPKNYYLTNDIAGFLGNGNVSFDYSSTTDSWPSGSSRYEYSTSSSDSIRFKVTYHYCATSFLAAEISNFSAYKTASGNVQLNWFAPNDMGGNHYEIEKSTNGSSFTVIESIQSGNHTGGSYQTLYKPTREDKSKVFFRIKQLEENGSVKYSAIRDVKLPETASTAMKVYPTLPQNYVNIFFPKTVKGDWQVNLISISGKLMQQSVFTNTSFFRLNFNQKLSPGMYIVEVINRKTMESQKSKIIVQ